VIRLADFLAANPDAVVHGAVHADRFAGFAFDSRIVRPGELFLAVRTDRADGHDYIAAACHGGATGVVCQHPVDLDGWGVTCVVVPDTEAAIRRYAAHAVAAAGIPVVAITGSAGKTTTKELIAHVLGARLRVFRNPANYSGRFGLPIALGLLEPGQEIAVLEMSADQFGEIATLARMAPPAVAVVTLVAAAHLAAFGSLEAIAREKGDLVVDLPPGGLAVLNADDPRVVAMAGRTRARVVWCGVRDPVGTGETNIDYLAADVRLTRDGTTFHLIAEGRRVPVTIPWLGAHFARSALFAVAVGRRYGLDLDEIVARLASLPAVPGRLNPLAGLGGSLILDDSYNASPAAVLAALDVLAALPAGRRVVVLGAMAELGPEAEALHRAVGRRAAEVADVLVARGREAEWIADEARACGLPASSVAVTYTTDDAVAAVRPHLGPDTVVLCKGSAVARMEQVVAALMTHPERAGEALVRQDAAWRQIVVLQPDRPTWLEIDLGALAANTRLLKTRAGTAALMAVLKADAYGHGAVQVAHTALRHGASWVGVACLSEGEALRRAGIDAPTLVLGYTPAWQARDAVRLDLATAVYDRDTAVALSRAAEALDRRARVHVKVDTGMHRLGVAAADAVDFIAGLGDLPGLDVEGLFTHLAAADDPSPESRTATDAQLDAFDRLLAQLEARGLRPGVVHAANTAALLSFPGSRYDLVRPGIGLYGLAPADVVAPDLRPALTWKTQIAQVRDLLPGEAVGYGMAWRAERARRIATIPVGYADGFRRAPQTWAHVLVRGTPAPVVGRVSMDQTTVDVTAVPGVRQGDEVVLIGRQGDGAISVQTVAGWLGTIGYEVVAGILARVPRVS
jgi:Alr-MurF fusion protein